MNSMGLDARGFRRVIVGIFVAEAALSIVCGVWGSMDEGNSLPGLVWGLGTVAIGGGAVLVAWKG